MRGVQPAVCELVLSAAVSARELSAGRQLLAACAFATVGAAEQQLDEPPATEECVPGWGIIIKMINFLPSDNNVHPFRR